VGPEAVRRASVLTLVIGLSATDATASVTFEQPTARIPVWPCRLVVKPPLLGAIETAWNASPTLRRQCRELADAGAVVLLEWGRFDAQTRARTRIGRTRTGTISAVVSVPPVDNVIELVAHELEHVLELVRGIDLKSEARRSRGVWKTPGGFESQRAIDVGLLVAAEVRRH
jgi:hypothetical protein